MNSKFAVLCLVVAFVGTSAFAVGFIGAPTADLGKGQWGIGANYSYSSQDLDKESLKVTWNEYLAGVWDDGGTDKAKITLKDFNVHRYYATLSYGVEDWWTIYAQLGLTDVKTNAERDWGGGDIDKWGMNFDNDFAWGLGTKITFAKQDKIDWGATLQMNWMNTNWKTSGDDASYGRTDSVDIDTYDIVLAVGPTIDMGGWKLYGGPYYQYLSCDYNEKWVDYLISDPTTKQTGKDTADISNNEFGGYIGATFDIASNCSAGVEYSNNFSDSWGLGTSITFKF